MLFRSRRKLLKFFGLTLSTGLLAGASSFSLSTLAKGSAKDKTKSSGDWAVGGTSFIGNSFPGDEIFDSSSICTFTPTRSKTLGPCYFSTKSSEDISAGMTGLPMQLCLRLVDRDCKPLSGYEIAVWHCDKRGVYSADTSNSLNSGNFWSRFCSGNDKAAKKSTWFRGALVTDTNGRVNFKSCFPGWYRGRAIHIHCRISHMNIEPFVSQFCFTDALSKKIYTNHSEYRERGLQDTFLVNGGDGIFRENYQPFLFDVKKNLDNTMLAYKTIQIS
jgi:protocatechuate 3,4-dioxygenase beta subunit